MRSILNPAILLCALLLTAQCALATPAKNVTHPVGIYNNTDNAMTLAYRICSGKDGFTCRDGGDQKVIAHAIVWFYPTLTQFDAYISLDYATVVMPDNRTVTLTFAQEPYYPYSSCYTYTDGAMVKIDAYKDNQYGYGLICTPTIVSTTWFGYDR
ncbi:MAG: hypothetical protein WC733_10015 [Methylophilus sp.]|jgi:hypothetical protein